MKPHCVPPQDCNIKVPPPTKKSSQGWSCDSTQDDMKSSELMRTPDAKKTLAKNDQREEEQKVNNNNNNKQRRPEVVGTPQGNNGKSPKSPLERPRESNKMVGFFFGGGGAGGIRSGMLLGHF
jgi:hypothetical protein